GARPCRRDRSRAPAAAPAETARALPLRGAQRPGRWRRTTPLASHSGTRARAEGAERLLVLAVRALGGMRHGEAAMVANELPAEAMIDQPGVAIRAGEAETAGAAERERRVAAAIEEEQRLLAALDCGVDRARECGRDEAAGRRALAAQ